MDKAEVKSRLEALRWMREEEKTFLECIEQAKRIYIGVAGIESSKQLSTYINYMLERKAACRQRETEIRQWLELVTDANARQVLMQRYINNCTVEQTAEKLCYSASMIYKLQHKGITEISVALNSERASKELRKNGERTVKECRNATP